MDNQKSNEATGSNMGKDSTQKGAGGSQSSSGSPSVAGSGNMGSSGSGSMGSSNAQSSNLNKDSLSSGGSASSAGSANSLSGSRMSSNGNQASSSPGSSAASGSGSMGSAGSMGSSASSSMGKDMMPKNADDMHKAIDKAGDSAQPVVDRLVSGAHAGVDKMSDMFSGASGSMDERKRQVTDAYNNFTATGREYVRNSPGTAVLGALAAGYLLSKIFGGRRH